MKRKIKLGESELKRMVAESVRRVLNESVWYGDTKPFEQIIMAASKIRQKFDYSNDEDYDDSGDCDGRDLSYDIYSWAKRIENEAEEWIQYNSSYAPINGGEDW